MTSINTTADLRLDQLAQLTGLSPQLIRAWERRYGVPAPARTAGGHRRYSAEQAELLRRAALLVRSGFRPAEAIARARAVEPGAARPADKLGVAAVTELLLGGDVVRALDRLRGAWLSMGFDATLEELVVPALHAVGEGWAIGRYSVADEHLATGVVLSWLGAVRAELPAADLGPPRLVLATPEGEQHAVAVWALELLLRLRGVGSTALGASVPARDLVSHLREARAQGLVLCVSRPALRREAARVAAAVRDAGLDHVTVYVGGAGAVSPLDRGLVRLPPTLTATADVLTETLGPRSEAR